MQQNKINRKNIKYKSKEK